LYRTGESFKNEVLEAITRRRTAPLRELFHTAQVLLLDDLEFMLVSPRAQEELMHLLDHLHRRGRQVIVSADRMPMLMTALGEPLRSRLEMGLITELGLPDEETRRRLVHSRAQGEGLTLDPEVVALLASRITTNLRRLEGAVIRLSAYATLHRRVITPEFALEMAAPFFDSDPVSGAVTAETLITRVAERFGLNPRELKGRSRSPNVTSARRMAVHLLKSEGRLSYPEIGTLLGNRSHSTIIHAHRTLLEELKHNAGLQAVVAQLRQPLGG
ncbi:MAG: DnaA/Hda family protein, partial [Deltaproteobacteria bacterium]|nr:DnaA/Hda family protein [Deltaproteobacteria bacterium]